MYEKSNQINATQSSEMILIHDLRMKPHIRCNFCKKEIAVLQLVRSRRHI